MSFQRAGKGGKTQRASGSLTDFRTEGSEFLGKFAGQSTREKIGMQRGRLCFRNLKRASLQFLAVNSSTYVCKENESRERITRKK